MRHIQYFNGSEVYTSNVQRRYMPILVQEFSTTVSSSGRSHLLTWCRYREITCSITCIRNLSWDEGRERPHTLYSQYHVIFLLQSRSLTYNPKSLFGFDWVDWTQLHHKYRTPSLWHRFFITLEAHVGQKCNNKRHSFQRREYDIITITIEWGTWRQWY